MKKVIKKIINQAVKKGIAEFENNDFNPEYILTVELTIADLRELAKEINWRPSKKDIKISNKTIDWNTPF